MEAQTIIDDVARTLVDEETVRHWTEEELLAYLNDGQRFIAFHIPEANAINAAVALVAGVVQSVPADSYRLLEVTHNLGTDGTTPGREITLVNREDLAAGDPMWRQATADAEVMHYLVNQQDRLKFEVYPPSPGTNYINLLYSQIPSDILITDSIILSDVYKNALTDYILYRAYRKDTDVPAASNKARDYFMLVIQELGLDMQIDQLTDPNHKTTPRLKG